MTQRIVKLHDPVRDFRDNCGFALLAHTDGQRSHWLVETTLESLARLTHRGAVAADFDGDGDVDVADLMRTAAPWRWRWRRCAPCPCPAATASSTVFGA